MNVEWYHAVVFICISLMANYFEHLILYLLTICVIFLEKNVYSDPLPMFQLGYLGVCFIFAVELFKCSLYILDINPLSDTHLQIFSPVL